jgi:hypothetical protein
MVCQFWSDQIVKVFRARARNWLEPFLSAAIIMIFVSCANFNEYVRNYQDCLTLMGHLKIILSVLIPTSSSQMILYQ